MNFKSRNIVYRKLYIYIYRDSSNIILLNKSIIFDIKILFEKCFQSKIDIEKNSYLYLRRI